MDKVQIKRVFLDMDGVISDLDMDMINDWKKEGKWLENFLKFIDSDGFEKLKMIDGSDMLLDYLLSSNIKLTILSSAGNPPANYYKSVATQKSKWLKEHGINVPAIIVQKKEDKQLYAGSDALLIDEGQALSTYSLDTFKNWFAQKRIIIFCDSTQSFNFEDSTDSQEIANIIDAEVYTLTINLRISCNSNLFLHPCINSIAT